MLEALRTQSKLPEQASLPPPSPEKPPAANPSTPSSGAQNPSTSGSGGGQNPGALPGVIWLGEHILYAPVSPLKEFVFNRLCSVCLFGTCLHTSNSKECA